MAELASAGARWAVGRWWRRRGLRARVTLTAAAGLVVAIVAAEWLLFHTLHDTLTRSVDDSARNGATEVAALINAHRLPDPVYVAPGLTIQVLDPAGRITRASLGADLLDPLLSPSAAAASARTGQAVTLPGEEYDIPSTLRVIAVAADNGDLVIAAVPYSSALGTLSVVANALVFGTPLVFVLFTGAIWLAVGSTLRPIGLLRRGAADVTVTGVPRDLPVPEARDEVRSLALTLNDMLSRLAVAQQRQRALVSDTAHELRSPIASIRAQLEVALDHPSGQDWETTAGDVHADVLRLARLAEDLLLLARLDEQALGARSNGAARTELAELARSAVARYAGAQVPVIAEAWDASAACLAVGDRASLDRLLVNLLDNAVRYAKSLVTVAVRREGEWAVLTVTDDGPGIPLADMDHAFDRFARLDTARNGDGDQTSGVGLGLAIVRSTARACGGDVCLEPAAPDSPSPGIRAVVRLPGAQ